MIPIALFGLSGVGKTTLAHELVNIAPDRFFIAHISTSRSPRKDDDARHIEFLSEMDFISSVAQGYFAMSWQQDGTYYGYKYPHLQRNQAHPILTCSLSAIQQVKEYGSITVLVTGDSNKGLQARGDREIFEKRAELNKKNSILYLNQTWFQECVDIEHNQTWGDVAFSVQSLYQSIDHALALKNAIMQSENEEKTEL